MTGERMNNLMIATAMALACAGPALAQQDDAAPTGPNWLVNCSNQADAERLDCAASQSVVVVESGARLLTAIFAVTVDEGAVLSMVLPFGLDLTAGVAMAVDGPALPDVPVNTCDAEACYARIAVDDAAIGTLREGSVMTVGLRNVQDQTVDMELTLSGFSAAMDMMAR